MAFRRKVDDRVAALDSLPDLAAVADIAFYESVSRIMFYIAEILRIPGIGQLVQVYDLYIFIVPEQVTDEIRPDESASPGDEQSHEFSPTMYHHPMIIRRIPE
jgi:hypothetical protein